MLVNVLPPRLPRAFLARERLSLDRIWLAGVDVIELNAPHGFGKTCQLAHWYREALAAGIKPIWMSLGACDDSARFARRLFEAGAGAEAIPAGSIKRIANFSDPLDAVTAWLRALARSSAEMLLLIDGVDLAPEPTGVMIRHLLAVAPSNLRVALAGRGSALLQPSGVPPGVMPMRLTARDLHLRENEAAEVLRLCLRGLGGADLAARIHALTGGWPMGVQLAIASQFRTGSLIDLDRRLTFEIGQYFLHNVVNALTPAVTRMLSDIARLGPINRDFCRAVLGGDPPVEQLGRLADDSPIVLRDEREGWYRLNPLARDALLSQDAARDEEALRDYAIRASRWYAEHGLLQEAAHQARIAGDSATALALAESNLHVMMVQGRDGEVLDWYASLSSDEIEDHPGFWAPAGWALALSNRLEEARHLVRLLHDRADATAQERYEADLIRAACAGFGDVWEDMNEFGRRWPNAPRWAGASEYLLHAIPLSHHALLSGHPEAARRRLAGPLADRAGAPAASWCCGELMFGLSYAWEGKVEMAREVLEGAFERAMREMERDNRIVSMIASLLAAACLEGDRLDEARRLLSLRVRTIEQYGIPETVIAAFTTLAEIADEVGRQDQAAVLYAALGAEGRGRAAPRMEAAAYLGLARLHARGGRASAALAEADRADALVAALDRNVPAAQRQWCELHAALARATAVDREKGGFARQAEESSTLALAVAEGLNRGAEMACALFLRARARERLGDERAEQDRKEAISLCDASGLVRLRRTFEPACRGSPRVPHPKGGSTSPAAGTGRGVGRHRLTAREAEVLIRLTNRLTNKEIALSMGVGDETVKWHLKNLSHKLDVGGRRAMVARARALGIV